MLGKIIISFFLIAFLNVFVCPISIAREVILENGTKVRLKLVDKVSSQINNEGDDVNFIVTDDVKIGDVLLIKEGSRCIGFIEELFVKGSIGRAGKLVIRLDSTRAVNGKKVPLTGTITKKGESRIITSAVLSVVLLPFFLVMTGKDAQLPAGYQFYARVDRDIVLSLEEENFIPVRN